MNLIPERLHYSGAMGQVAGLAVSLQSPTSDSPLLIGHSEGRSAPDGTITPLRAGIMEARLCLRTLRRVQAKLLGWSPDVALESCLAERQKGMVGRDQKLVVGSCGSGLKIEAILYPDGLEEEFSYDANGNPTLWTNGNVSEAKNHEYDNANRLTKVDYYSGTDTTFSYDDADRMTQMVDASGTSSWTYNAADEVTQLTTPQGTVNYVYKLDGQLEKIQQSGLSDLVYRYDSYGRVDQVTSAFSEVTGITYDGTGSRVTQKTLPNGNYETYTYDVRGRVEDIVLKNSGHTVLRKLEHTYDAVDNITEIVETRGSAVTKTFGYDDIDQLISEDWSTGYAADYEYDENGNRTKRTVGATVEDYFYDDGDKLTEIKIGATVTRSYDYDMSGRRTEMTDGGGTTYYAYDLGDRLTSITRSGLTTNSFGYNGFDTRVSKTDSTGTTAYKRAGAGVTSSLLKSTISGTTTDYTPGISSTVSSTSTFMHSGLKNSDEQSGSGGTIAASLQYDAFGKQVSSSGTWVGAFKYGGAYGYQTDPDHGLKLLGHRYYEADTGRFLTRDPIKDGRNWYGYCENGPVGAVDSDGLNKYVVIGDTGYMIRIDTHQQPMPNAHLIRPKGQSTLILANGDIPLTHGRDPNPPLSLQERRMLKEWGGMSSVVNDMKLIALAKPRTAKIIPRLEALGFLKKIPKVVPFIGWTLLLHTACTKGLDAAAREFAMQDLLEGAVDWTHGQLDGLKEGAALMMQKRFRRWGVEADDF